MVQVIQIAVAALALAASSADSVFAQRQRKAWRNFSPEEKQKYKDAVVSSMKSGLHFQFAEAHASSPNRDYAHYNCGFLLWHRKFLLAYENMLRDQGDQFKDVTLPYWNYFYDSNRQVASGVDCNTMLDCSQFLSDMGGLGQRQGRVKIADLRVANGICAEDWLSQVACASPNGKSNCGCIPRGNWRSRNFLGAVRSSTAGKITNLQQGATSNRGEMLSSLSMSVENSFHSEVHNDLGGGSMASLGSPFDPVFYGHHATVDLVHYVHNHCYYQQAGPDSMGKFKMFESCNIRQGRNGPTIDSISPTSEIHIQTNYPQLQKYLDQVGKTYNDFADATNMGDFSYTYVFDDWINDFLKRNNIVCPSHKAKHHHHHHRHHHHLEQDETYTMDESVSAFTAALSNCTAEVMLSGEVDSVEAADYVGYVECEIIRQKQGHDHTDYSLRFREDFEMGDDMHKYCFEVSQMLTATDVASKVPESCRQELAELTDTDLVKGFGKKLPCKGKGKGKGNGKKHGGHIHIKIHSSD